MCVLEYVFVVGKLALSGQDIRKAGFEFVEAINADPTHFGAYKCMEIITSLTGNSWAKLKCTLTTRLKHYLCAVCIFIIALSAMFNSY